MTQQVETRTEVQKASDTAERLAEHCPRALPWYRLWQADLAALRLAKENVAAIEDARAERLVVEHANAERSASLWYLSVLMAAELLTSKALSAHDAPVAVVERLTERRLRLCELAEEVGHGVEP